MPLLKIDVMQGRSDEAVQRLLDTVHRSMVDAFEVPERDRYQVLNEHRPGRMIIQDTGLGFQRTDQVVVITVVSRPRSVEMKKRFYALITENLERECGIAPTDVVISIVTNSDEDWSFGLGRGQFLTAEL